MIEAVAGRRRTKVHVQSMNCSCKVRVCYAVNDVVILIHYRTIVD